MPVCVYACKRIHQTHSSRYTHSGDTNSEDTHAGDYVQYGFEEMVSVRHHSVKNVIHETRLGGFWHLQVNLYTWSV